MTSSSNQDGELAAEEKKPTTSDEAERERQTSNGITCGERKKTVDSAEWNVEKHSNVEQESHTMKRRTRPIWYDFTRFPIQAFCKDPSWYDLMFCCVSEAPTCASTVDKLNQ